MVERLKLVGKVVSTFLETLLAIAVEAEALYQNCKTYASVHDNNTIFFRKFWRNI